jgi:hypothetical protein
VWPSCAAPRMLRAMLQITTSALLANIINIVRGQQEQVSRTSNHASSNCSALSSLFQGVWKWRLEEGRE